MDKDLKKLIIKPRPKIIRCFLVIIGLLALSAVIILLINYCVYLPDRLEVDYLDVGQGDSELIQTRNHQLVLIDGGPDNLVLWRLGEILPFYQKEINYVILSHFHDDHITGLVEIFKRYKVNNFIYLDNYQSPVLDSLLKAAFNNKVKVTVLNNSARIDLGPGCFLNLLNPNIFKIKADPNNSIITKLECDKNKFLFSGDNSFIVERALLNSDFDLKADILKASHHGSNSANSEAFLKAVAPIDFIISDGKNNKFKHPSPVILERARTLGFRIFRTDEQKTIRIFGLFQ
ncbi:MAG: ComEC/Rec2 family competence protein [Patescibacteria group bacterium]